MSLRLVEMLPAELDVFRVRQAQAYAQSLFDSGSFDSIELAVERATTQIAGILKNDQELQHFCRLLPLEGDEELGVLWWALRRSNNSVWIYDIEVHPEHRRKGYARLALRELEAWCVARNCSSIGLNVFAFNAGAEKLYREMGFVDVSKQMKKLLLRE
jgi:GNAT superfamily N-acetyltransferase